MKTTAAFIVLILCAINPALTQDYSVDETSRAEIKKLKFMEGEWLGSGWMIGPDRQRHEFEQTENIKIKLEGTALLIEGHGTSEGETVHMAMAIVRWDKEKGHYNFSSFLPDGRSGVFKGEIIDGKFYWYPRDNMSYIISVNDKGQWYEKGEMTMGENTFQFFEMTLDRLD